MYEGRWSPFDPRWYQEAFDKYISTADQLFNTDLIIQQGYHIPDYDGSKSSVFRNEAVLNNSFNEDLLRESLTDIYLNSSHKLIASNHDNTHFFQWNGHMSDMTCIPNTHYCEFKIPTETLIYPKERDMYKMSQFYRKWIKVEDLLNNWNVFKWHLMVFIDQKIYSEYELRIDDHETTIKFKYNDYWVKMNHPVYIYKFDTNAQCRFLISKELCMNQWNWKMPISHINDPRIMNSSNVIAYINKISDQNIREDGLTEIEVLGDNLEFLEIKDGFIDLSKISNFNRIYIESEATEWLWMSIVVPKFFHEYPILLPTESIYRPYEANFQKVVTLEHESVHNVKGKYRDTDENKQVYVDINGHLKEDHDGWKTLIRPVVLTDAFDPTHQEPYKNYIDELRNLRDLTVEGADILEDFRFFLLNFTTDEVFDEHVEKICNIMNLIREAHNAFLDRLRIEYNQTYESKYKKFINMMEEIKEQGVSSDYLTRIPTNVPTNIDDKDEPDFWFKASPLIWIPRELADKYYIIHILDNLRRKNLWVDMKEYLGQVRFQRPIEEHDFWSFEYYPDDEVWRPYPLQMNRHFPDVYLPSDPTEETPTLNRLFKTFFFYSDTMNVTDESNDIIHATPTWDEDVEEYHFDPSAVYRDIFMEKFYWMGVRTIYKGLLVTQCRWEAIEYIVDNPSYERFNQLFMKTMDPYFKLGLATYLKSANYEFPFDDAIDKMQESINTEFLGYKRVTNFEVYLNKTWIPSYFDYIVKIMDNWDYSNRLVRRPRSTFGIDRLLPMLIDIQDKVSDAISSAVTLVNWILKRLVIEDYNLNIENIEILRSLLIEMDENMKDVLKFTKELDLQIYSIDDINYIINGLRKHIELTIKLNEQFVIVNDDVNLHNVHAAKRKLFDEAVEELNKLPDRITDIAALIQDFDMDNFMKAVNDLTAYFTHDKRNPDDNSLIGHINIFDDAWSVKVKESRNKLFVSTSKLFGTYEPTKSYSVEEVEDFVTTVSTVKDDITNLRNTVSEYYEEFGYKEDQIIYDKLDYVEQLMSELISNLQLYLGARGELLIVLNKIKDLLNNMDEYDISDTEKKIRENIFNDLDNILVALSYIAGTNRRMEAFDHLDEAKTHMFEWLQFLNDEEEVFNKLLSLSQPPVNLLGVLKDNEPLIIAMIDYMDTVNIPFIPDNGRPTYSDIYEVDEIEVITPGFNHEVGDRVFIPKLGSYVITSTIGDIGIAESIDELPYRKTTFRDPMIQNNLYDSITSGVGIGITIKPLSVKHQRIINDEVISQFITRIQNVAHLINRNIDTVNPHNNANFISDLETLKGIKTSWDEMLEIYSEYMTEDAKSSIDKMIDELMTVVEPCEKFIEKRDYVNIGGLLIALQNLIFTSYEYITGNNNDSQQFFYYDENLRVTHTNLIDFNGTGTRWSDGKEVKAILADTKLSVNNYMKMVYKDIEVSEEIDTLFKSIIERIDLITNTINDLPMIKLDIDSVIRSIGSKISAIEECPIYKDLWYQIKNVNVAIEGYGYKAGDIVEIVPEEGEEFGLLLQIVSVEDGKPSQVRTFMNYAIPYMIWGVRETKSVVGKGFGLKVDFYSYEVTLSDSTLFEDKRSDISKMPPFDENDLFMFKFENIHDLDLGYEVFLGGKQISNYYKRHVSSDNPHHPKNIDIIYVNANEVINLQNSSIYIPAEHYFIYKIDNIDIVDPGTGYAIGQGIFVDSGNIALKLKVEELDGTPYKGLGKIDLSDSTASYSPEDPAMNNAKIATDSLNNIDDEYNIGYYDQLTKEGIKKPATLSYDQEEHEFHSKRFDKLEDGNRNKTFMYPDVDIPDVEDPATNGDPDYHWYLGSRIDNSQHPMTDERLWNGIMNLNPPTDPFIADDRRLPPNQPPKGEYQLILRERLHNSNDEENNAVTTVFENSLINQAMIVGDLQVQHFSDLPRHTEDYPDGAIDKKIIVEHDETHNGHRMMYRIRSFVAAGFFVYDLPEVADYEWNTLVVDWMNIDFYPDYPSLKAQYPSAPWDESIRYRDVQEVITDKRYDTLYPTMNIGNTSYIADLTIDDISVFNWTTKKWEDLHDENRWKLDVINDDEKKIYKFTLTLLEEGSYSYDMRLYLNKIPDTQMRNAELKRDAVVDITSVIVGEVNKPALNASVYTGRDLRIRKLFPYEQRETFVIGKTEEGDPLGYEMDFKVAEYMHFRNELHLEDIKIYNRSAERFENVLDTKLFEVRFKDDKVIQKGSFETQTRIIQSIIGNPGEGFVDGEVWGWNSEYQISIFGRVTADFFTDGHLLTFTPIHCPNPPEHDISLEFRLYQSDLQNEVQSAVVMIEFKTEKVEVWDDGYIHNVTNRLAPIPKEFKVIAQYDLDYPGEYDIILSKSPRHWEFVRPDWEVTPKFHINEYNIQSDRLYVLTDKGRFPLVNPSTKKPTLNVVETSDGTDVTFLNLYRRYEHFNLYSVPYPMRSVYVQRNIPSHGYIDLKGKINKPLNKKYFEFWVNGKLLSDEVTIITPTKIFLHGLKSLKNFEIIEINRDSNEYFSDEFLEVEESSLGRPHYGWKYDTYLDDVLEAKLEDNYTEEEQEYLLSPIWRQVELDHPEFKNYPPNVNIEDDVLLKTNVADGNLEGLENPIFQFLVVDAPTLEGHPLTERTASFKHFGLLPITDDMIVDMLNEEWEEEIANGNIPIEEHYVMSDDEWYGMATRLYDEYGILVHTLDESAYHVSDVNLLKINVSTKLSRIVKNPVIYNLD